jgi:hypothetical protein
MLERSFSLAYATNGSLLMAFNQVRVATDVTGAPVFTNNIVDLMFKEYSIGLDLGITTDDIRLSTNNLSPGQTVDVIAVVHNFGELAATNIAVAFFAGNPASGALIGSTQHVAQLTGGASTNVQVTWTIPMMATNQAIYIAVDPEQLQADRNRTNNITSRIVLSPDLVVSAMSVLSPDSDHRIVIAEIINDGVFPSGNGYHATFRRGMTNGPILATMAVDPLAAGARYNANFEWDLSESTFTEAFETIYAIMDLDGVVPASEKEKSLGMAQVMTSLDTDGDGLLDGEEMRYGSNINLPDSDGDGLLDGEEVHTYGTSPILADSDGDGMKDGEEIRAGTDPNSKADLFTITEVDSATGLTRIQWSAKSSHTYQVMKSWELLTWTNAPTGPGLNERSRQTALTNGIMLYIDPLPVTNSKSFYRVNLQ